LGYVGEVGEIVRLVGFGEEVVDGGVLVESLLAVVDW
jgi:hypothetical protein